MHMLGLAVFGGALEFYDFVIFIFVADVIGVLFFPPDLPAWLVTIETFGIFATGYLFRPLGGVVLAHFGDLFGRRHVFVFSILLMAISTLAVALLPDYSKIGIAAPLVLVFLRILQGIAIGGEIPGAWTFTSEHVAPSRVGFACGLVCSGLAFGVFLAATITMAITSILSTEEMLSFGWRLPFLFGGVFGGIAVYLRRMLHETPVFASLRARRMLVPELPLSIVLKNFLGSIFISVLCTWVLTACVTMLTLLMPTILQKLYYVGRLEALKAASVSAIFMMLGLIGAGFIVDRIGPARSLVIGGTFLAVGAGAFSSLDGACINHLYLASAVIGLSGGVATTVPVVMVWSFPAPVRFSGVSFSYNISYAVFGGMMPLSLGTLLSGNNFAHIYYLLLTSAGAICLGFYIWAFPASLKYRHGSDEQQAIAANIGR